MALTLQKVPQPEGEPQRNSRVALSRIVPFDVTRLDCFRRRLTPFTTRGDEHESRPGYIRRVNSGAVNTGGALAAPARKASAGAQLADRSGPPGVGRRNSELRRRPTRIGRLLRRPDVFLPGAGPRP